MSAAVEKTEMNLMEWLKTVGLSVECFALVLEIDKSYVYKMIRGECVPGKPLMRKIKKITKGKIDTPDKLKR